MNKYKTGEFNIRPFSELNRLSKKEMTQEEKNFSLKFPLNYRLKFIPEWEKACNKLNPTRKAMKQEDYII